MPFRSAAAAGWLLLGATALASAPAGAQTDREQGRVRDAAEMGQMLPLPRIVSNVQSRAPYDDMTYLGGPVFEERTLRYRLKFLDGKQVVVVVVDARTGRVIGRAP